MLQSRPNVVVRPPRPDDAAALAAIFADAWRLAYTGIVPHLHIERMIRSRTPQWWAKAIAARRRMQVLEVLEKTVGYVTYGPARRQGAWQGEIFELYLDPVHQGLGFGEHLFECAVHELELTGLRGLFVWALAENEAACGFYWRRGGRPVTRAFETIGGREIEKIGFGWA